MIPLMCLVEFGSGRDSSFPTPASILSSCGGCMSAWIKTDKHLLVYYHKVWPCIKIAGVPEDF